MRLTTLKKRADFLAANRGRRAPTPGFVLLVHARGDNDPAMRVGYTVSKKVGNAVVRNRLKRRLRALAAELLPDRGLPGADHILIGRPGEVERPFDVMRRELERALARVAKDQRLTPVPAEPVEAPSFPSADKKEERPSTSAGRTDEEVGPDNSTGWRPC